MAKIILVAGTANTGKTKSIRLFLENLGIFHEKQIGDLVLDKRKHTISLAGSPLSLTRTEFLLLERLMEESGSVVARKQLIEKVWGPDAEVSPGALDTFINSLRGKLGHAEQRSLIGTVRGTGYFLSNEPSIPMRKGSDA